MEILDLGIDYGTIATITAKTTIIETGEGSEQRNSEWNQCLLSFQIGERTLDNGELSYLQSFHEGRKGSFEAFLFKDWSDYLYSCSFTGDGIIPDFQLFKTYIVATQSVNRAIQFPKTYSVKIDGVEQLSGFTVGAETGILNFTVAPTGTITVEGEFYVPVRFGQDDLKFRFNAIEPNSNQKIYTLDSTTLTEIRFDNPLPPDSIRSTLNHVIDLGYDFDTFGGQQFNTQITPIASGFEERLQNWANSKGIWDIGNRSLLRVELDYLIALFRVTRGRAVTFQYRNYAYATNDIYKVIDRVRFAEDSISFRFDAYESEDRVIFNLAGVPVIQSSIYSKVDPTTYIVPLIDTSGSMADAIPFINQALTDLRPILRDLIYGKSQFEVDKYFKPAIPFNDERYVRAIAEDYRNLVTEPKKYLFVVWQNEAAHNYHNDPRNAANEPTPLYRTDYNNFLTEYDSMDYFSCLIISPTSATSPTIFDRHLYDSIEGKNGYQGLKQYGVLGEYTYPIDATASDIFDLLSQFMAI